MNGRAPALGNCTLYERPRSDLHQIAQYLHLRGQPGAKVLIEKFHRTAR